jgi:hypothetical protein
MTFINSIKNYSLAESLFDKIQDNFQKIEEKTSSEETYEIDKLIDDIKRVTNILNRINVDELSEQIEDEDKETIEFNINFIYESLDYMEKYLLGEKYRDNILVPIRDYIKKMFLHSQDYSRWASDEDELAKKYAEMLTHPNNVLIFQNFIKRLALGTVSQREFLKIFNTNKHKMIPSPKSSFKSFKDYKEENKNVSKPIKFKPS